MKQRIVITLFLLGTIMNGFAAKVDTIRVFSDAMKKNISSVVVTPDRYTASKPLPVVYILHGFSDSYKNGWIGKIKNI
ncbi:MAG: alpha/beta hydrolase-fold protein, partial [Bacteroidales bacterium]|nr:alpha/beta hydrolase-fold protein [Bacteroidales bacterium]